VPALLSGSLPAPICATSYTRYALWLGVRNNPLTVIVAKDDYQPTMTHRRDHEKSGGHHRLQAQESVVVCCF
jgi:hypothetical protein